MKCASCRLFRRHSLTICYPRDGRTFSASLANPHEVGLAVSMPKFMDINLRVGYHFTILASAKAASPDTHVIVITGFATMETAKESYRQGAFDFVAKPFKLCDLLECVKLIAESRQAAISAQSSSQ